MTSTIAFHAGPSAGFDQPFEMLVACHERVERMLRLLERLQQHLAQAGNDASTRQAATDVMRYFDLAGPAHHEDEERHLFPALRERGPAALAPQLQRLQQDHETMVQAWAALRADLQQVADGRWSASTAAAAVARAQAFARLYREHIVVEEGEVYPAARALFDADASRTMGQEMARRRGQC